MVVLWDSIIVIVVFRFLSNISFPRMVVLRGGPRYRPRMVVLWVDSGGVALVVILGALPFPRMV
eukprot:10370477-Karenia_brevis.AAC.1